MAGDLIVNFFLGDISEPTGIEKISAKTKPHNEISMNR
jgi:hypothetical protein